MKISEIQQPNPLQKVEGETETKQSPRAQKGSRQRTGDVVELSSSLEPGATRELDEQQAQRVAALKARMQEGSYRVDATLVARKMLSSDSGI